MNPNLSKLIDLRNRIQQITDVCIDCERNVLTKSDLKVPTRNHIGQPKSECRKCRKCLSNENDLRAHAKAELERQIANEEAEENRNEIIKNFKKLSESPENVNMKEVWKILRNIFPKFKHPLPIAKRNFKGKLITVLDDIKTLLLKEYSQRLRKA